MADLPIANAREAAEVVARHTVDITPTWRACLPIFLLAYESGTPEGRIMALEELRRMAAAADAHVAEAKMRDIENAMP